MSCKKEKVWVVIKSSQSAEIFSELEVFRASGNFVCTQTDATQSRLVVF